MGVLKKEEQRLVITIDNLAGAISLKRLLKRITEESLARLATSFHDDDTFFHSLACSLEPEELPKIRQELKALMKKYFCDNSANPDEQRVYQCVFHIWPFKKA